MFKLISLGFLIWAFKEPLYASISFIGLFVLIEGYFLLLDIIKNPNLNLIREKYNLTDDEVIIYKKYYIFYTFPAVSLRISQTISGFGLSVIIWIPLLLYNKLWVSAIIIGLNLFMTFYLSKKLNPLHFANYKGGRGKMYFEKRIINSVQNKIFLYKNSNIDSILSSRNMHKTRNDTFKDMLYEEEFARTKIKEKQTQYKAQIKNIEEKLKEYEIIANVSASTIDELKEKLEEAKQNLWESETS